jgi:hypothetical protein
MPFIHRPVTEISLAGFALAGVAVGRFFWGGALAVDAAGVEEGEAAAAVITATADMAVAANAAGRGENRTNCFLP